MKLPVRRELQAIISDTVEPALGEVGFSRRGLDFIRAVSDGPSQVLSVQVTQPGYGRAGGKRAAARNSGEILAFIASLVGPRGRGNGRHRDMFLEEAERILIPRPMIENYVRQAEKDGSRVFDAAK